MLLWKAASHHSFCSRAPAGSMEACTTVWQNLRFPIRTAPCCAQGLPQSRENSLSEISLRPIALTRSSTERVEMPWMQASWNSDPGLWN